MIVCFKLLLSCFPTMVNCTLTWELELNSFSFKVLELEYFNKDRTRNQDKILHIEAYLIYNKRGISEDKESVSS